MDETLYRLKPNPGKKLELTISGQKYNRYPLKTSVISASDNLSAVVFKYAKPHLKAGDMLFISERVVAITQGRMRLIKDIKTSFWANLLVKFVYRPSWGIGIGSPATMQVAIDEAGLWRILLGCLVSAATKPFGIRGMFYRVVGSGINAIDGPTAYTLPPGNKSATLGPKEPDLVAQKLSEEFFCDVVIIDANDIGIRVEGSSRGVDRSWACGVFADNPLGQSREQTPMAIVRAAS